MQSKEKGFTLLEILVVLLIVGITLGFAILAFGDFGRERRILTAAEQFVNYVKFVQQQAILETTTLGITLNNREYQVLRFQPVNNWQPIPNKRIFHQQHFPSDAIVHLTINEVKYTNPQIVFNASGEMTPFKLSIGSVNQASMINIIGLHNGMVTLKKLKSP